jgi:fatty acid/phospholipid biosynthesis enzyme
MTETQAAIYRYNFSKQVTDGLYDFSKIHQYDDRKTYKEAWDTWVLENTELIDRETKILYANGYVGNIVDKMYKSARYYFRKKSTCKQEPKKRRQYISLSSEMLYLMDMHIQSQITQKEYKPAIGYENFCILHQQQITKELTYLCTKIQDIKYIQNKFKKTYKNRYYIISRSV